MHPHEALIGKFYESFRNRNADGMIECYHDNVEFTDPVFDLKGWKAKAMWQMLCESARDMTVEISGIQADDQRGRAHWEPVYTFSKTGRRVHNIIDAEFAFRDGKIIRHRDHFDLWRWAGLALGTKGKLLGWLPPVQGAIRKQAAATLAQYIERKGLGPR